MLTVRMHPVDIQYLECNRYVDKVMELVDELHISQVLTLLALLVQKSAYVSIRLYLDYKRALQKLVDELHISQVLALLCFTGTKIPAVLVQKYKYVK